MSETKYDCKEIMGKVTELRRLQMEFDGAIPEKATGEYSAVNGISARLESLLVLLENEIPKTDEEIESENLEKMVAKLESFLIETWKTLGVNSPGIVVQKPFLIDPKAQNLDFLKKDIDPTKFGEYTLNPECLNLDLDQIKDKIVVKDIQQEIEDSNLTSVAEIGTYVINKYSKDYVIPDLSFWQWMIQKYANAPEELKDGNFHYCFGSILRRSDGYIAVPMVVWRNSEFLGNADIIGHSWIDHCRVVLIER